MKVLVPTARPRFGEIEMARRPGNLEGKVLGFMWNDKPNGDVLLKKLEDLLKERLRPSGTLMRKKPMASSGAPPDVLEELSAKCDFVILAIGDCGSCTSWLVHDAVELEKRGTPTLSICTDEFAPLGRMEVEALKMPRLPMVIIPHPLGGLRPEEVEEKARAAIDEVLKALGEG